MVVWSIVQYVANRFCLQRLSARAVASCSIKTAPKGAWVRAIAKTVTKRRRKTQDTKSWLEEAQFSARKFSCIAARRMTWRVVFAGILTIALISLSLALILKEQSSARDELLQAKANIEESIKAIKAGNFGSAEEYLSNARLILENVERFPARGNDLIENEGYASALQMYGEIYRVLNKLNFLFGEAAGLFSSLENLSTAEALLLLPRIEIMERGILESEVYLRTTTVKLKNILGVHPEMTEYGLTEEFRGALENLTPWYLDSRADFQERFVAILSSFPDYKSFNLRELSAAGDVAPIYLNSNVVRFFNALDRDKNGTLSFEEVQNLFYWSKWKIEYRADGRDKIMEILSDPTYWSTPSPERIKIVANDEELSSLYATFLNYYQVRAHAVFLTSNSKAQNHFVCIIKISDSLSEFRAKVGDLLFFKINGEFGIPGGYYLILDPLSDAPFYMSEGKNPSEFNIERVLGI